MSKGAMYSSGINPNAFAGILTVILIKYGVMADWVRPFSREFRVFSTLATMPLVGINFVAVTVDAPGTSDTISKSYVNLARAVINMNEIIIPITKPTISPTTLLRPRVATSTKIVPGFISFITDLVTRIEAPNTSTYTSTVIAVSTDEVVLRESPINCESLPLMIHPINRPTP